MTTHTRLIGSAILLASSCLLAPPANAQSGACPGATCVVSQTWLVPGNNNTMDVYTTATQDYYTTFFYGLCINFDVLQVNGPASNAQNWPIIVPSMTPTACYPITQGFVQWEYSATFNTTPGTQYWANGYASLAAISYDLYNYGEDCSDSCSEWVDLYGYSDAYISTADPEEDSAGIEYTWPGGVGNVFIYYQIISTNSSGMYSFAAATLTAPIIAFGQGVYACSTPNIAGLAQYFAVGQRVAFTACVPSGYQVTSWTAPANFYSQPQQPGLAWPPPTGQLVGGSAVSSYVVTYTAATDTTPGASAATFTTPSPPACATGDPNCDFPPFYWVDTNNTTAQFTANYTQPDGTQGSTTVAITFAAPSLVTVSATPYTATYVAGCAAPCYFLPPPNSNPNLPNKEMPFIQFGGPGSQGGAPGMTFSAAALSLPNGYYTASAPAVTYGYQWLQVNSKDAFLTRDSTSGAQTSWPIAYGLDTTYPYGFYPNGDAVGTVKTVNQQNDTATDSPFIALASNVYAPTAPPAFKSFSELARSFSATMWLMWIPQQDNRCINGTIPTDATHPCAIQVPLVAIPWGAYGDLVNTLNLVSTSYIPVGGGASIPFQYQNWVQSCSSITPAHNISYEVQLQIAYPVWGTLYATQRLF